MGACIDSAAMHPSKCGFDRRAITVIITIMEVCMRACGDCRCTAPV